MIYIAIALVILLADQLTKYWVVEYFSRGGDIIHVIPCFDIVLTYNRGVSFSLLNTLSQNGYWILSIAIVCLIVGLIIWAMREKYQRVRICFSLIIGGALGNLIDRIRLGKVVDFILVYWSEFSWPAFNLADSAICIGAVAMSFFPKFLRKEGK